jgi:hypothetical protein
MKLINVVWGCVALLVGAVVFVSVLRTRPRPAGQFQATDDATSIAEMHHEVDLLRDRVRLSERLAGAAAFSAASASRSTVAAGMPNGEPTSLHRPATDSPPNIPSADLFRRLDMNFRHEQKDPSWSAGAMDAARAEFTRILPAGAELRGVDCSSTTCKGTVSYRSKSMYEQASHATMASIADSKWVGGMAWSEVRAMPDGTFEVDQFLFREGHDPVREAYDQEEAARIAATD